MKEFPTVTFNPIELSGGAFEHSLANFSDVRINGLLSKREDLGWFEQFVLESGNVQYKIMVIPDSNKSRRLKRLLHRRVNIKVERSDV